MASIYYIVLPAAHGLAGTESESDDERDDAGPAGFPGVGGRGLAEAGYGFVARRRRRDGRRLALLYSARRASLGGALGLWHEQIVSRAVSRSLRRGFPPPLWLGLMPVELAVICNLDCALRALERSDQIFRAYAIAFVFTFGVGVPSTLLWGPFGAIVGLLGTPSRRHRADAVEPASSDRVRQDARVAVLAASLAPSQRASLNSRSAP